MSKPLPFFVMLNHPSCPGNYTPMDSGEHDFELARFATKKEAEEAARNSVLGGNFGYEVFEIGEPRAPMARREALGHQRGNRPCAERGRQMNNETTLAQGPVDVDVRRELPAPRIQLRWEEAEPNARGYQWACHYELVLPLGKNDIRREVNDKDGEMTGKVSELVAALKEPTLRGSSSVPCTAQDGSRYYDAPYRDGAHAKWDADALGGIPIYVIAPDGVAFEPPNEAPK